MMYSVFTNNCPRKKWTRFIFRASAGLAVLLLAGSDIISAQTIKGVVVSRDGQLPGATVKLPGSGNGTATDLNGQFTVTAATTGKVKIEIAYIGHETKELELELK